jgi:hypothetical protein
MSQTQMRPAGELFYRLVQPVAVSPCPTAS